jgi:hypothetical protein
MCQNLRDFLLYSGSAVNYSWRFASNGELYRGVHGPVHVMEQVQGLMHFYGSQLI